MDILTRLPEAPFTLKQARALGISRREVEAAIGEGLLLRVMHGVYVYADLALTPRLRAFAAGLVTNPTAIVCDRTAAWLWGVDCFRHAELDGTPALETCVLRHEQATERAGIIGMTRDLRPGDWVDLEGVRVTTPLRTALDLGSRLWAPAALGAMDALAREHGFSQADLARQLPRYRRRRGVVQLRLLVSLVDPRAESQPESAVRYVIVASGLAPPEPQVWVEIEGERYRLDLAYPRAKIAVEYDGAEFHSSREQLARDRDRRAALRRAGWIVLVLTRTDLAPSSDQGWLVELGAALRSRGVRP
jgi:hypothetical protein